MAEYYIHCSSTIPGPRSGLTAVSDATPLPVQDGAAATSGGASHHRTIAANTTNATVVKGSAGQVYSVVVNNTNAAVRYLKLYDKATAPTVGTDTPVQTYSIPATGQFDIYFPKGLAFTLGIGFALTTGIADSDTAAVGANEHIVNISYK